MTSRRQPERRVTVVKNRLQYPDGTPRCGEKVEFVVRAVTDWREDHTGRVVSTANTWTNSDGCWRTPLLSWDVYEAERNTIVEVREGGVTSGYIQVPPTEEGEECWMRELLVTPPPPIDWRPISRLGDLHDVDYASVSDAPDGSVLVKRGGMWVAAPMQLGTLDDVDAPSVANPDPEAYLQYVGSEAGWGVIKQYEDVPTPEFSVSPGGDGYTIRLSWSEADPTLTIEYRWGDEASADEWHVWPDNTPYLDHKYIAGTYFPQWRYQGSDKADSTQLDIPQPV